MYMMILRNSRGADVLVANTAQDSVSCNGLFDGSKSVTVTGGNLNYTYQWDVNAGSQTTDTATTRAGTYCDGDGSEGMMILR